MRSLSFSRGVRFIGLRATGYGLRPEGRDYRGSANSGSPDSGHGGFDAEKWGTDGLPDAGERVAEWFGLHRERTVHEHVVDEGRARFDVRFFDTAGEIQEFARRGIREQRAERRISREPPSCRARVGFAVDVQAIDPSRHG